MSKTPIEIVGRWRRYRSMKHRAEVSVRPHLLTSLVWVEWLSGPLWLRDGGHESNLVPCLLWSLALEVDEHRATRTGEQVCRACGARGVKITRLSTSITIWHEPDPDGVVRTLTHDPCRCTGPTRPHTVSLRRLVSTLASWRSPIVTDWPEQWAVNRDRMEAANWGEVTLPGDDRPTPAWVCQWWRAFGEWTAAGKVSDVGALAKALESRIKRAVPIPASFVVTDDDVRALNNAHDIRAAIIAQHDEWIADGWMQDAGAATITGGDVVSVGSPPAAHWVTPHDASQWFNDDRERSGRALADLNDGNRMLVIDPDRESEPQMLGIMPIRIPSAGLDHVETETEAWQRSVVRRSHLARLVDLDAVTRFVDPYLVEQRRSATARLLLDSQDMGERIIAGLWLRMDMVPVDPPFGFSHWPETIDVVLDHGPPQRTRAFSTALRSDSTQVVMLDGCDADDREMAGRWLDRLPDRMMPPRRTLTP